MTQVDMFKSGAVELNLDSTGHQSDVANIQFDESTTEMIKSIIADDEELTAGMVKTFKAKFIAAKTAAESLREYVHVLLEQGVDRRSIKLLWNEFGGNLHTLSQYLCEATPKEKRDSNKGRKVKHETLHTELQAHAALMLAKYPDINAKGHGATWRSVGTYIADGKVKAAEPTS